MNDVIEQFQRHAEERFRAHSVADIHAAPQQHYAAQQQHDELRDKRDGEGEQRDNEKRNAQLWRGRW